MHQPVLLDKDESCPTADLSNVGRPSGLAYSTGELLNTPLNSYWHLRVTMARSCIISQMKTDTSKNRVLSYPIYHIFIVHFLF